SDRRQLRGAEKWEEAGNQYQEKERDGRAGGQLYVEIRRKRKGRKSMRIDRLPCKGTVYLLACFWVQPVRSGHGSGAPNESGASGGKFGQPARRFLSLEAAKLLQ